MRLATSIVALLAACDSRAAVGERCENDAACVPEALCHEGRCAPKARVQKARAAELAQTVEKAREQVEAAGLRVQQADEAFAADSARPDGGDPGGGLRTTGAAEKAGEGTRVTREDYQRRAVGKEPP